MTLAEEKGGVWTATLPLKPEIHHWMRSDGHEFVKFNITNHHNTYKFNLFLRTVEFYMNLIIK